jgi:hypothetical protein
MSKTAKLNPLPFLSSAPALRDAKNRSTNFTDCEQTQPLEWLTRQAMT